MKPNPVSPVGRRINKGAARGLLLLALLLGSGCAARKSPVAPDWLAENAPKSDTEFFYGAGCAQPEITNWFLKRATAEERARVALAFHLQEYLHEVFAGDTTAVRAVIEAALPGREEAGRHEFEDGQLCVRSRLSRPLVEKLISDVKEGKEVTAEKKCGQRREKKRKER